MSNLEILRAVAQATNVASLKPRARWLALESWAIGSGAVKFVGSDLVGYGSDED